MLDLTITELNDGSIVSNTQFNGTVVDGGLSGGCVVNVVTSCEEFEAFNVSGHSANGLRTTGTGFLGGDLAGITGGHLDLKVTTPEPGAMIIFGSGMLGLAGVLRRKLML